MSLHIILHPNILSSSNKEQFWKEVLQRNFPTPYIMPKQNFRTIPDLISHMSSKSIPSPPNTFPHAKPIRTRNLLGIVWQTFLPLISFLPKKFNIHSKRFCQDDCAVFISSYPNILMFPSSIGPLLIILSPKHIISFCSFKLKKYLVKCRPHKFSQHLCSSENYRIEAGSF
jgi:hypothetical protein